MNEPDMTPADLGVQLLTRDMELALVVAVDKDGGVHMGHSGGSWIQLLGLAQYAGNRLWEIWNDEDEEP